LGEGPVSQTYLNAKKIIDIALDCGAQAIHPGYGFLSENTDFVELCEAKDIVFIGPSSQQIRAFGLKHSARQLAQQNDVPLLPGSKLLANADEAQHSAQQIGFPVMLKSSAGGGGIGMQVCTSPQELESAFDSVKRLSENHFSDSSVFLEKYIEHARHIEVQVFGDGRGKVVAFGERDCSAQRRHQKVIEETPAANLSADTRQQLATTAVRLAAAVNYRNAGTVEFIFDDTSNKFYFLEVNTRLQVEHGVTERVFNVDLVEWMVKQAYGNLGDIESLRDTLSPRGHAIQARIYAENPAKEFQPAAGLLNVATFPPSDGVNLRIDTWVESGIEVSALFDPLLAKVIVWSDSRQKSINNLCSALEQCSLNGVETNKSYVNQVLQTPAFVSGSLHTRYLNNFRGRWNNIDVISPGTMTTIQDFPGRVGYWNVGVPPSGPFDNYSFQLANKILGNPRHAAALEITVAGPSLKFSCDTQIALCGAEVNAKCNQSTLPLNTVVDIRAGDLLEIGKVGGRGCRVYLAVAGGLDVPDYLGSKSTFTLGQFGGFNGRALKTGDVLHVGKLPTQVVSEDGMAAPPEMEAPWILHAIYGPHGAPDFFSDNYIDTFFTSDWEVHYNSSRTGIRLIGPKPEWTRESGGEAGMHPSNIHDNAYAVGAIDFTGDMPVILGPDGPSLGGFVCPATVISADLWKLGQLKAGDRVRFARVSQAEAVGLLQQQNAAVANLGAVAADTGAPQKMRPASPVLATIAEPSNPVAAVYRHSGDSNILVEYGPQVLDLRLRFRIHALMQWLEQQNIPGVCELTPGIRSLQVHFDPLQITQQSLLDKLCQGESALGDLQSYTVPSRIVHLPLSWNDSACQVAVEKYMRSVRKEAPWCPDNIEFIRRINGLESVAQVKDIVFAANYLVMGLGDVYLGAPVATPLDPRHRLVTTKYNPARTWTAENSVGIGGAYLCVYGMEGPGGYQFVGRTLQMWNRHKSTADFSQPWLLRFFDQIKFFEVSEDELQHIRREFPKGRYRIETEHSEISLTEYETFLQRNQASINAFTQRRERAFASELDRWIKSGQMNFSAQPEVQNTPEEQPLATNQCIVESSVAGSLWKWQVKPGQSIAQGDLICVVESMKMEIEVHAPNAGTVTKLLRREGDQINAGQALATIALSIN
nr:urea carboxylase [Cellvibrionaceae bacterium]